MTYKVWNSESQFSINYFLFLSLKVVGDYVVIDMVVEAPAPASYDLSQCLAAYHHNALYVSSLW